jgi:chemotaxis signal transduction protein
MSKTSGDLGQALSSASSTMLEVVTFFAGGQRCAMEARQVRALRPFSDEDGRNYPALDSVLGLPELNNACSHRQILTIRLPESEVEFSVAVPVELSKLELASIHPLPELIAARTQLRGLCALALETDGLTLMFDLRKLA